MAFHHVALATRDLDATHRFYTEAMGFELVKAVVAPTEETAAGPSTSSTTPAATASSRSGTCTTTPFRTSTPPSPPGSACRCGSTTSRSTPTLDELEPVAQRWLDTGLRRAWRSTTASACRSTPSTPTASWSSGAPTPARSMPDDRAEGAAPARGSASRRSSRARAGLPPVAHVRCRTAEPAVERGPAAPRLLARPRRRPRRRRSAASPSRSSAPTAPSSAASSGRRPPARRGAPPSRSPTPAATSACTTSPAARRGRLRRASASPPATSTTTSTACTRTASSTSTPRSPSCAAAAPSGSCCSATAAAAR